MLNVKVFAAGISHLTDARYFSAMGADFMSFEVFESSNLSQLKEMKEWVEGPIFVGEWRAFQANLDDEMVDKSGLTHWIIPPFFEGEISHKAEVIYAYTNSSDMKNVKNTLCFYKNESPYATLNKEDKQVLIQTLSENDVILDIPFDITNIRDLLLDLKPYGIVLRGGEEEKVGFKSYDELDEIFDIIAELK